MNQEDKIWEALKQYKAPEPKPGYISRFWIKVSQDVKPARVGFKFFIPKPWALASLSLSILLIIGVSTTPMTNLSNGHLDSEIVNNIDLAEHWQGIEHADLVDDLKIIEKIEEDS